MRAIAKKHGITTSAVGSYFRNLKGGPNAYNDLLKQGYEASVIPLWVHRPASEDQSRLGKTTEDQPRHGKTTEDYGKTPDTAPLGQGVPETQGSEVKDKVSLYTSRQVPDEELQRLGIVKSGDGRYFKASPGSGGSIVLRPVDSNVAMAAEGPA